ncbi:MAG: peptidase M23B [Candidatus Peregrinibacteria bacterium Gr01-1014_25]|nr:MAG: peptidase M23B [Candidatus Peregrinibacteria bacterium Gr01-1014_25]
MHTPVRRSRRTAVHGVLIAVGALAIAALPASHLAGSVSRGELQEALVRTLDHAGNGFRSRVGVERLVQDRTVTVEEARKTLQEAEERVRVLEERIADAERVRRDLGDVHTDVALSAASLRQRAPSAGDVLRATAAALLHGESPVPALHAPLRQRMDHDRAIAALRHASVTNAAAATLRQLRLEHEAAASTLVTARAEAEEAERDALHAEENARAIQAIMRDVHEQVLRLQGELARIDARLRAKAERELIAQGLLDPSERRRGALRASAMGLQWPARGPLSAGYLNADYQRRFGVPHRGLDIVVGAGTAVHAAADGVVFLVRDGGATGYTYVLLGHRGGLATLYGHLSAVTVAAGQEVTAGQFIGLSGGQPGTHGAGPMTTGAHLHFEVIKNGSHIDPLTALP